MYNFRLGEHAGLEILRFLIRAQLNFAADYLLLRGVVFACQFIRTSITSRIISLVERTSYFTHVNVGDRSGRQTEGLKIVSVDFNFGNSLHTEHL